MASIIYGKRPGEEILEDEEDEEGEEEDDGFLPEGEEETDGEKLGAEMWKMLDVYRDIYPKTKPLEDGWETDGESCFTGRYIQRSGYPCIVRIYNDIIKNKDQIKDTMTYRQELVQSEGFDVKTIPPPRYDFIRVLDYNAADEYVKKNIEHHARLAVDAYNGKCGDKRILKFVGIDHVNVFRQWNFVFYITLWATGCSSNDRKLYQTRIRSLQTNYEELPTPCMLRVDVFRPFQSPKTELVDSWHFLGSSGPGPLRKYGFRGTVIKGTLEDALDQLESLGVGKP